MSTEIIIGQLPEEDLNHNIELIAIDLADHMIKNAMEGGLGNSSLIEGEVLKVFYPQIYESGGDLQSKIRAIAENLLKDFANKQGIERPPNSLSGYRKKSSE